MKSTTSRIESAGLLRVPLLRMMMMMMMTMTMMFLVAQNNKSSCLAAADAAGSAAAFVHHPSTRSFGPLPSSSSSSPSSFFGSIIPGDVSIKSSLTGISRSSSWSCLAATKKNKKGSTSTDTEEETTARKKKNNHEKWQPFYDALVNYQSQHGHCNVSLEEDASLCEWLEEQRTSYKNLMLGRKTKLTRKRAVALEMLPGVIPPELLEM